MPGLHLSLIESDFTALLHWLERTIVQPPEGLYQSSDVTVTSDDVVVTLNGIDWSVAFPDAGFMVRMALKLAPGSIPVHIQAKKDGVKSLRITWSMEDLIVKAALALGGTSAIMGALTAHLGNAVVHEDKRTFILHLDRLPDPMPQICKPWSLIAASIPGGNGVALILNAVPA